MTKEAAAAVTQLFDQGEVVSRSQAEHIADQRAEAMICAELRQEITAKIVLLIGVAVGLGSGWFFWHP